MLQAGPHQFVTKRDHEIGRDYDDGRLEIGEIRVLSDWHRPRILNYWRVVIDGRNFAGSRILQPDGSQTVTKAFAELSEAARHQNAKETVLSQIPPEDLTEATGFKSLQDIIPELIARGAQVCLVSFPVAESYQILAMKYPSFAKARARITALAARHGIRHVDLWNAISGNAAFSNSDHMNHDGARRLARLVKQECEKPVLAATAKE